MANLFPLRLMSALFRVALRKLGCFPEPTSANRVVWVRCRERCQVATRRIHQGSQDGALMRADPSRGWRLGCFPLLTLANLVAGGGPARIKSNNWFSVSRASLLLGLRGSRSKRTAQRGGLKD